MTTARSISSVALLALKSARTCLQCPQEGATDIVSCKNVARCAENELCFTEVRIVNDQVKYYAGCKFEKLCQDHQAFGKRDDNLVCQQCCKDIQFCNSKLCDAALGTNSYLLCLSCQNVPDPDSCDEIQFCDPAHTCFSQVHYTGGIEYHLGCNRHTVCDNRTERSDMVLCGNCCQTHFCNYDLCRRNR